MKIYVKALLATLLCTGLSACYNIGDGNQSPQAINVENKLEVDNLVGYFPVFADSSSKGYFYIHNNSDTAINDVKIDVRDDFYNVISLNTTNCGDMAPHTECKVNFTAKELANRFQRSSANFIISYDGIERTNRLLTYANAAHLSDSGIFFNGADGAVKNHYNMYYLYAGSNGQNKLKLQNVNLANENSAIVTNHHDFNNLLGAHQVFGVELHSFNDEGNELQVEAVDLDDEQPLTMKVPLVGGAINATGATVAPTNIPVTMSFNTTTLSLDPNYKFVVTYTNSSPTTAYSLAPHNVGLTWNNSSVMNIVASNGLILIESMILSYYAAGSTGADCATGKINPSSTCAYYVNWGAAGSPAKNGRWLYDNQGGQATLYSSLGVFGSTLTTIVSPTMPIINPDLGLQGGAIALAESTTSTAMKYKYSFVGDVQNKRLVVNLTVINVGSESLNKFTFTPFSELQMGANFKTLVSNSESAAMRQTTCPTATNGIVALQPNKSCGVTIVYNLLAIPANTAFESGNDYIKVSASYARAVGTATVRSVSQSFIVSATNYALSYNAYTGVFLTKGESSTTLLNSSQSNAGAYPSGFNLVQGMYFKTRYQLNATTYGAAPKTVISAPSIVRTDGSVESTIATAFKFKFNKVVGNPTIDNSIPTSPTCELNTPGDICELEVINLWRYDQLGSKNASYTLHTRIDYVSPYFLTVPQIESFTFNSIAPAVRLMQTGHTITKPFDVSLVPASNGGGIASAYDGKFAIGIPWLTGLQYDSPYNNLAKGQMITYTYGSPTKRFESVPNQPNCIYDKLTGLMWLNSHYNETMTGSSLISTTPFNYSINSSTGIPSAIAADTGIGSANSKKLCGVTGWRVPTSNELVSLVNYGLLSGQYSSFSDNSLPNWLDAQGFKLTSGICKTNGSLINGYCDSISITKSSNSGDYVEMLFNMPNTTIYTGTQVPGATGSLSGNNVYYQLMLVRTAPESNIYANAVGKLAATSASIGQYESGEPWPVPRFVSDATNNCIIDKLTGLIYPKNAMNAGNKIDNLTNENVISQYTAIDNSFNVVITGSNFGICGRTDWRLANIVEANSLVDSNNPSSTPVAGLSVNWPSSMIKTSTQIRIDYPNLFSYTVGITTKSASGYFNVITPTKWNDTDGTLSNPSHGIWAPMPVTGGF